MDTGIKVNNVQGLGFALVVVFAMMLTFCDKTDTDRDLHDVIVEKVEEMNTSTLETE